ncbi:MAG: hypothetical protein JWN57_2016 [Frankiales bacterium]|nr:hypothetical protein [Frankiales bacterium]
MSGPSAAGVEMRAEGDYRGRRLGLPADGPGSAAAFSTRLAAFAIDAFGSGLVARLIDPIEDTGTVDGGAALMPVVVLAVVTILGLALVGQTPGMRLLRLRVMQLSSPGGPPGLVPSALRTALLVLLVPALVADRDGRGLHDKAAGTVVVRA